MTYRYIYASPESLASGQPLSHGDEVSLTPKDAKESHNQWLIQSGRLLSVGPSRPKRTSKTNT